MAPEIVSSGKYSNKADIFSFGVLVYVMFEGRIPWIDKSRVAWKPKQKATKDIYGLIDRCISEDPYDRPSACELSNTFKAILAFKDKKFNEVIETIL